MKGTSIENIFYYRLLRPLVFESKLGRKSMFGYADSGINFDHIYSNQPKGYTGIGKLFDAVLLNLPASRATRERKENIIQVLINEVERNRKQERITRIVDLASGPSRYLVELIDRIGNHSIEALCLDIDKCSINYGEKIAAGKPMVFKRIDAFQISRLRNLSNAKGWHPNAILVSGLYEYHTDVAVLRSLRQIYTHLEPGGLALTFFQASNPSKKIMEKLGRTKDGLPWVLHYRSPEQVWGWMHDVGFVDVKINIDKWGMYVLCLGRKPRTRPIGAQ